MSDNIPTGWTTGQVVRWLYVETAMPDEDSVYTVGFYDPDGRWHPESDHDSPEAAVERLRLLNGATIPRREDLTGWEEVIDALDHIARVCRGSRSQTRRIRWIGLRAQSAIDGNRDWREVDIPKTDPLVQSLQNMIAMVYPICLESIEALQIAMTHNGGDIDEAAAEAELETWRRFDRLVKKNMGWLRRQYGLKG